MKMETKNSLGNKPLPGERQDTSGADAGRDSVRTVGDRMLNRRAPVIQQNTANTEVATQNTTEPQQPASAEEYVAPPTATVQQGRRRMKWTNELNAEIMRSYYRATEVETNLTVYRARMHQDFTKRHPELSHLTEQRIADQRRAIITNNLLPGATIDTVREEIYREVGHNTHVTYKTSEVQIALPCTDTTPTKPTEVPSVPTELEEQSCLRDQIGKMLTQYKAMDPCSRHRLPKISYRPSTNNIINKANKVLSNLLTLEMNLEEIHRHIYCAAAAVITENGQKICVERPPLGTPGPEIRWHHGNVDWKPT